MGFFDDKGKQIEYLEEERQKLWDRIGGLEKYTQELKTEIGRRASDDEKEARQSSKKASEYKNKIEAKLVEANQLVEQLTTELDSARKTKNEINEFSIEASQQKLAIDDSKSRLDVAESNFEKKLETITSGIGNIDSILERYPDLESQLEEIDDFTIKIEENLTKSGISLSALNKSKKDIDDLHLEVFGYTQTDDETGDETKIRGLKDELYSSYDELKEKIGKSFENVDEINTEFEKKYESFEGLYKKKYKKINDDIAKLLPDAMTAGLSSAFSSKKDKEVESSGILQQRFNQGINLMIAVSLIPVVVSIVFLIQGVDVQEVIMRVPRLVLAIIPMYIPVLWFTYSANKKLNLSKRLIEEYSHKEVLSKTYEGLSTQIENLDNPEQSEELKFRLLANFLQASSENPGKLISNYEASDHPVMEALEQSYKFQMTIDKLEGIPGMGKVAAILDRKAKKKISVKDEVLNKVLSGITNNGENGVNEDEVNS
ncbi:hypothetical protein [Flavivirga spongiicola]|uniref:Uncharacterized protein n=1 Tax=Flavivirga spongiicola TaxID=421621 RepID=A0ABU7XYB7_9FLAO|nr:hypothetical protein [Flavivirga sp. MEBiC05379]MDO5980567.1 hypothetical protein [Flavivirga sp. MEBiC05379]